MAEHATKQLPLDDSSRRLVARLWSDWMRPYLPRIIAAALLMAVVAGVTGLYPLLIEQAIDRLEAKDRSALFVLPLAIVAVTFAKGCASYGQSVISQSVAFGVIADLQKAMFAHLMRADLAALQRATTGQLVSRFTNDVNLMRDALAKSMTGMARDFLIVLVMVGTMFWLDWLLALIVVVFFPVSVLPIVRIGRRLRRTSTSVQVELGDLTANLTQAIGGARLVKAYRMEEHERARANALFESVYRLVMKMVKSRSRTYPMLETLGGLAVASVLSFGGWRILSGAGTLGEFTGFLSAVLIAYQPMRSLGNLNASLQEGLAAIKRTFDLLDEQARIVDAADAKPLMVSNGEIRFDHVSFHYDHDKPALDDLTLTVPAGKTVALVGPSGAGKSSVLNLIPRFFDTGAGAVCIDGQNVAQVTIASLRDCIALVSQDITLFNDSVRANIAFGARNAGDAAIEAAAKAASAHDFISALPNGYDTLVGDHGSSLSGGERQRIAIARAMLKDAPILLLDEATSALDAESERHVQAALARLTAGRTTLVIAHRLSTVMDADIIYVLEKGRLVESGTHDELQTRGGLYARLCRLQFQKDPGALSRLKTQPAGSAA